MRGRHAQEVLSKWSAQKNITDSECMSTAIVIQHATRTSRIILSPVTWWLNRIFHLIYNSCPKKFLIHRRIQWGIIVQVHMSSCSVMLFLSGFNQTWILSKNLWKDSNIKFDENPYSGDELFRANGSTDRQTDMTKIIVIFRKFVSKPK